MSESDYIQAEVDLFLRACIKYPIEKPDDDVEMNYKEFLDKIEEATQGYPTVISGNIEYYFSAIRYLAYQKWLDYLGFIDNKDWFEVILNNLENLGSHSDLYMLSKEIVGLKNCGDYSITWLEYGSGDKDHHLCNDNNRFENINRQTLIYIAANILNDKIKKEIETVKLYLALKNNTLI